MFTIPPLVILTSEQFFYTPPGAIMGMLLVGCVVLGVIIVGGMFFPSR